MGCESGKQAMNKSMIGLKLAVKGLEVRKNILEAGGKEILVMQ